MPTEIRVLGWESEGFRCPDHQVSLLNGNITHSVSLIQMPNGTGKTTTLDLLRAALSGSAANGNWDALRVRSLRKKGPLHQRGRFNVKLLVNGKRLTIEMIFDFEEGTVSYTTTVQSGIKRGFEPPREVARFLKPDFVNFLAFNGELAEHLLSHEHTNAQSIIEDLFQLKVFSDLKLHVDRYWSEIAAGKSAIETKGLSQRRNKVDKLRKRIEQLTSSQERAQQDLEQAKDQLCRKRDRFQKELEQQETQREQVHQAESDLAEAKRVMDDLANDVFLKMRDPQALSSKWATELVDLKLSLDRVKLPESAAREFFEELAQEDECVCGRPLDDKSRSAIRMRAKRYLGSEDVSLLNIIKSDITNLVGENTESHESELNGLIERLRDAIAEYESAMTKRDAVLYEATQANPKLKEAEEQIEELKKQIHELEEQLEKYDDPADALGDDFTFGIVVLRKRLENAELKFAEVTKTLEIKAKTAVISRILESAHTQARTAIGERICLQANERIESLIPYNRIKIDRIDRCLRLRDQDGGSVGEQLAVAYAFLATLFNRSEHSLPFIVDSPANPIDLHVRAKVAELIPRLADQFIAFTISSERQSFLEPLEANAANSVQHLTLFRKGDTELEDKARIAGRCVETSDGVLVCDRTFFCDFQLEDENGGD